MSNAVVVEGLCRRFANVVALDDIHFEVPAGTVMGLLGPNGAGKTTTVRVLATILTPDQGRAEVLGHDVVRQAREVRSLIGLAGQYAAVDANLTGAENLRLTGRLVHLQRRGVGPRAAELLDRFGLSHAADRPVRTYSGGMRRRLDLAAALVHRPPVLFLDEPTTGLDLQGRSELWDMIRELVGDGTTVLLTTQYLEEADRLADRVAVVDGGRLIANDTPTVLKGKLGNTVIEMGSPTKPPPSRHTCDWPTCSETASNGRERSSVRSPTTERVFSWTCCGRSTRTATSPRPSQFESRASTTYFWPLPGAMPRTLPISNRRR
jgi:daunorubicin resistance ABC transporter ATP-binding subunit